MLWSFIAVCFPHGFMSMHPIGAAMATLGF